MAPETNSDDGGVRASSTPLRALGSGRARRDPPEKVKAAIDELRTFHAIGAKSRKECDGYMKCSGQGNGPAKYNIAPEMLRKARLFAERYERAELEGLCGLAKKHGFAVGKSLVTVLMSVEDKAQRQTLQRLAIRGHWRKRQLDMELWKRFGSRNEWGGRKPRRLEDEGDARYAISRICDQWGRLVKRLNTAEGPSKVAPAEKLETCVCKQLARGREADQKAGRYGVAKGLEVRRGGGPGSRDGNGIFSVGICGLAGLKNVF